MIKIFLTNLGRYNEGDLVGNWYDLPVDLEKALKEIGVDGKQYEEFFITDYDSDLPGLQVHEYENIDRLNEIAEQLEKLEPYEVEKLQAYCQDETPDLEGLQRVLDNLEGVNLYPDEIRTLEDLGIYLVQNGLFHTEIPEPLEPFIDYEMIGKYHDDENSGGFTSCGYLDINH